MVKILVDFLHPAHVHFFRNFILEMQKKGHQFVMLSRNKDCTLELLDKYKFKHQCLSRQKSGKLNLLLELLKRVYKTYRIIKKEKPDVLLSVSGACTSICGFLTRTKNYAFYGTENARIVNFYSYHLSTKFLTGESYRYRLGKKHILYKGSHELAYLRDFKPNPDVLKELNLKEDETFTIMRLVAWRASHDMGHQGISDENKLKAIREFEKFGKVFISSEKELPENLRQYKLNIPVEKIHSLISFATLVYGESATLASESATLGTYSIYLDNDGRGFTDNLEKKYGLVKNFTESEEDQVKSIQYGIDILKNKKAKQEAQIKKERLLKETVDMTKYMMEMVENG